MIAGCLGGKSRRSEMLERTLLRDEVLFREGDSGTEVYIVESGSLRILKQKGDEQVELNIAERGEIIGELAFLGRTVRSATVVAAEETHLIELGLHQFRSYLDNQPNWLRAMIDSLIGRVLSSDKVVATNQVPAKVAERVDIFLQLRDSVKPAYAVLAGIQLDLFTVLGEGARTADEIATLLGADAGKLEALLNVLVLAEFLTRTRDQFENSRVAEKFFVRGGSQYAGDMIRTLPDWWTPVLSTADSVATGVAQAKLDYTSMLPDELEAHFESFYRQSLAAGEALASRYDFTECRQLLDVGGGTGGVTIGITAAYPSLRATLVDLPTVTPVTQRYVAESDSAERISIVSADAVEQPLEGMFDAAIMSAFMPVLGPTQICQALHHVSQSMEPGGTLYVTDGGVLDDSRLAPVPAVHNDLWFVNVFDEGRSHPEEDRRKWLTDAGFEAIERDVLPNKWVVLVARKLK